MCTMCTAAGTDSWAQRRRTNNASCLCHGYYIRRVGKRIGLHSQDLYTLFLFFFLSHPYFRFFFSLVVET